MFDAPHPGQILKEFYLDPLGMSIQDAAQRLGISQKELADLVEGQSKIDSEMADRLSRSFGRSSESWVKLQAMYDLSHRKKKGE